MSYSQLENIERSVRLKKFPLASLRSIFHFPFGRNFNNESEISTANTGEKPSRGVLAIRLASRPPINFSLPLNSLNERIRRALIARSDEGAHEKRVGSGRLSYISAPIGAFGAQINQPLVASSIATVFGDRLFSNTPSMQKGIPWNAGDLCN
jgi:hypothetical protein